MAIPTGSHLSFPVSGPAPFTHMVVVQELMKPSAINWMDLPPRISVEGPTSFAYPNYSSENPPQYRHSTTVSPYHFDGSYPSNWTMAVDQINDCYFNDSGWWMINTNVAMMDSYTSSFESGELIEDMSWRVSSWILLSGPVT
jgi:hypothetical protein